MVKKIITALLFVLLIVLAFLQYFYIRDTSGNFSVLGKKAAAAAEYGDMEKAYASINALNDEWHKEKDYYEALMEHSESDKITTTMLKALSFAGQKDKVQFLAEMNTLIFLLEHIHEIDSFSIENIL